MQAVLNHHIEIVSCLVSIDPACLKTQNINTGSLLDYAAANNNTENASVLLKALKSLDKLSTISSPDNDDMTNFNRWCSKGHLEFSKWLLEEYKNFMSESDPLLHTIQDNNGYTLLMQAVLSHHLEIVSWRESIDPDGMKLRNKQWRDDFLLVVFKRLS